MDVAPGRPEWAEVEGALSSAYAGPAAEAAAYPGYREMLTFDQTG